MSRPSGFRLVTRTNVRAEALFDASLSIDEHVASMSGSGERAVGGVTSGSIGLGETVTWRARHFGVWFRMTSAVTELSRPDRFVDEQVRGPFRIFRHVHSFAEDEDGTSMVDELTIASPVFGVFAERLVLVPYLRRLIRSRNRHLLRRLGHRVGTDPAAPTWRTHDALGFRRFEVTARIGHGDRAWARASRDVLDWKVKTRSGFRVDAGPVEPGRRVTVRAPLGPWTIREPVEIVAAVRQDDRVGFAYRTRPGHPVRGEEAFIVHRRDDGVVFLTIRSLTAPAASGFWRAVHPFLRVAQWVVRRRYLRALG